MLRAMSYVIQYSYAKNMDTFISRNLGGRPAVFGFSVFLERFLVYLDGFRTYLF